MELEIRLFASLKDRAGQSRVSIEVAEPATVSDVTAALVSAHPSLAPALPAALVAVNRDFAFPETAVAPGDEVALFPPVSGGDDSFPHPTYFAIAEEKPDIEAVTAHLATAEVGATVFFQGTVRGATERSGLPAQTQYLEYEAYQEMARQKMVQIAYEIWERWPAVRGVAIIQRIGRLEVGDTTTFVACASPHRDQGVFEAARYGIDRLKEIVPIWKKEVGADESVWVEGDYRPTDSDRSGGFG